MTSPSDDDTSTEDLSQKDSLYSIGPLVGWTVLAVGLLAQIIAFMLFVRHRGFGFNPLNGFPITIQFVSLKLLAAIVIRCIVHRWITKETTLSLPREMRQWARVAAELAAIVVVFSLTAYACSWPKVLIPVLSPSLWDGALIEIDALLCLGINPNEFFLTIFEGAPTFVTWTLDRHYALFIFSQGLATAWFLTDPRPRRRIVFGASVTMLWILGTWSYYILPTLGPVYVFEDFLSRIAAVFPLNAGTQVALLKNYESVHQAMAGEPVTIIPHMGIAAMPSLHVAAHFFLFLWARRVNSRLRNLLLAMSVLTFIGSVATGWHYLVDGLAGLMLAAGVFFLAIGIQKALTRSQLLPDGQSPQP